MARNSTTKVYNSAAGGASAGTDLHAWMLANIAFAVVGSMYSFGAGTSERNYWTLTYPGGMELCFACPNGTAMDRDDLFDLKDTVPGNWSQPTAVMMAPSGGLEAALAAGEDPQSPAFVDYIVNTIGAPSPAPSFMLLYYSPANGSVTNHDLYFIEDDTLEALAIHTVEAGNVAGDYAQSCIFASDLIQAYPSTGVGAQNRPEGYFFVDSGTNGQTYRRYGLAYWDLNGEMISSLGDSFGTNFPISGANFDAIDASDYPPTVGGDVPCWTCDLTLPNDSSIQEIVRLNPLYVKLTGVNHQPYKTKFGSDSNYQFTRIVQRFVMPWDNNQADPL